jgi:predicted HTH transcriptional regulator
MASSDEFAELDYLVRNPAETRQVEIKTWFDPKSPEGVAKIVKACLAMRNSDGGRVLIGFHNETCEPDTAARPDKVREVYANDSIQKLIKEFASLEFDVAVRFVARSDDSLEYPIICVPSGVKTPVAARKSLILQKRTSKGEEVLVKIHAVYTRSLNANHTIRAVSRVL